MRKVIYPQAIISHKNALDVENLKIRKSMQVGFFENTISAILPGGFILLDFGKQITGSLRLVTWFTDGDKKVRVAYGESVSEAISSLGLDGTEYGKSMRSYIYPLQNLTDLTFTECGFRFVLIEAIGKTTIRIKNAVVIPSVYGKSFTGSFHCDDPLLNRIYDTSAYTLRLCLRNDVIWDGTRGNGLVWAGDLSPDILALNCLYGRSVHAEKALAFLYNESPLPIWMNNIPSYSLWWIITLRDQYLHNGNANDLTRYGTYLSALVEQIGGCVSENGEITWSNNFFDNYTQYGRKETDEVKKNDEAAGIHALTVYALRCAKELLAYRGLDTEDCNGILVRLCRKSFAVKKFSQSASLRVFAGIGDENDRALLLQNGAGGMTPFLSYYIARAVSDSENIDSAIGMMKKFYGAMLSLGATSFWEHFDMASAENAGRIDELPEDGKTDIHKTLGLNHSLCHGWSCGPIPFLTYVVGGIQILKPGCREIRIAPKLGHLRHVKITYPTPYGILRVEHTRMEDGSIRTEIDAPDGVRIV